MRARGDLPWPAGAANLSSAYPFVGFVVSRTLRMVMPFDIVAGADAGHTIWAKPVSSRDEVDGSRSAVSVKLWLAPALKWRSRCRLRRVARRAAGRPGRRRPLRGKRGVGGG